VKKLHEAFRAALVSDTARERFKKLGITPVGSAPEETARRFHEEAQYWRKAVKTMNIRLD
jgi:tripartite-type tricarboxylate transporter receptor subunit TctC